LVIRIKNLRLSGILGVYEEERRAERNIVINAEIEYDAGEALRTDLLEHALDYKIIRDRMIKVVTETKFRLIETLVDHIVQALSVDARISRMYVEVDKPNAMRLAESVSASVTWHRSN
jgi:D-erythro-7,8-dihydroneopterin triphosphate epimerase